MPYNLIDEPWIPVRRRSGAMDRISPSGLAPHGADPVVALDWPRADLRIACLEFLIGLMAAACPPVDEADWRRTWDAPPDEAGLRAAFAPLRPAFDIDGDGPRFLQDFTLRNFKRNLPPPFMFIEAPGEITLKNNADILVPRGHIKTVGRAAAAMALYTLQAYAPQGGAGYRVGMRGGGPLVTLAIPPAADDGSEPALWSMLWANVPCGETVSPGAMALAFPWLAPTRASDENLVTRPGDAHPVQAFWGMPRRMRLVFAPNVSGAACELDGEVDPVLLDHWSGESHGVLYAGWRHPLTPYYIPKKGGGLLPRHVGDDGVGYQHWQTLVTGQIGETEQAAACILTYRQDRHPHVSRGGRPWRLLAAGYNMEGAKAKSFAEGETPVYEPASNLAAAAHDALAVAAAEGAKQVASLLVSSVHWALLDKDAPFDGSILASVRRRFWAATQDSFHAMLATSAAGNPFDQPLMLGWRDVLDRVSRQVFAQFAPIDSVPLKRVPLVIVAERNLRLSLAGYGKKGRQLFSTLGLAAPEPAKAGKVPKDSKEPPKTASPKAATAKRPRKETGS